MPTRDEIRLTLPCDRDFHRVAHLVLGGLALRHELTIETLEDLQLALAAVLEAAGPAGEVTVAMTVVDGSLETTAPRSACAASSGRSPTTSPSTATTSA